MNEIFLRPRNEAGYIFKIVKLARELEAISRAEDPFRYTAISANRPYDGNDIYHSSGLFEIPRIVAWHMYFGWYYGKSAELGNFLDTQHARFPQQNIFVSEYGSDYDTRLHSLIPVIGEGTAEWSRNFHESYLEQLEARPYLAGTGVWAMFEFGSEARGGSYPHLNTKGIFTFDRKPKDAAFLFQAYLSDKPVLHIAENDWKNRSAILQKGSTITYPITIYTNLPQVEMFVNKKSLGIKDVGKNRKAVWDAELSDGQNDIEVRGKSIEKVISDKLQISLRVRQEPLTADYLQKYGLAINLGATAWFTDSDGRIWEPDQAYQPKSFGFIGGKAGKVSKNITNTPDDPLYQTFRQGLSGYRFDIPDGDYEIELRFIEPVVGKVGERVFSFSANGVKPAENVDLFRETGLLNAVIKKFKIKVTGNSGLLLEFQAIKGETVLSAVVLRKSGGLNQAK